MATNINFYINSTLVNPPKNWRELMLELNFDSDKKGANNQVTVTDWEWVNENADIINKWITDGLTSGVGVFEGIPFHIEVERDGVVETPFDGYLDLTATKFSKHRITTKAVETNRIDWLNDVADGFTFSYLKDIGLITNGDYTSVPYILNSVPNYVESAVSVLGVYVMVKEIKDAIHKISEFIADAPVFYVPSTYVKIILYIIYLGLILIALIKLIKSMVLLIIQPVKYHKAMSVKRHLEIGAQHLGMTFDSPIFNEAPFNDSYIIPEKFFNPTNSKEKQILGFTEPSITQEGHYKGTFGDLLRECKKLFNAKIIIVGTQIKLVREDYSTSTPTYILPPVSNNYDYRNADFELNTSEFNANYLISFVTDSVDKNTIQDYLGTSYQVITQPNRINNTNMRLMKGFQDVRINFALAKRKNELTVPEAIFNAVLKVLDVILGALITVANAVIQLVNKIIQLVNNALKRLNAIGIKINFSIPSVPTISNPNIGTVISNRIGMLRIEKDMFNVNKICVLTVASNHKNTKIHASNDTYFSAKYLYENYHFINSFVQSSEKPNANQYYLKTFTKVPFSFKDYEKIKENNRIFTTDGDEALIDTLKWNVWNQQAEMRVRVNKLYTNNLVETFLEPDGK